MTIATKTDDGAARLQARAKLENLRLIVADVRALAKEGFLQALRIEDLANREITDLARMAGIGDLPEYESRRQRIRKQGVAS